MPSRLAWVLAPPLALLAAVPAVSKTVALLPVQDRAGDAAATALVAEAVGVSLAGGGAVIVPHEQLRTALRERRIRRADAVAPARLAEVATAVGADELLSVAVVEADRGLVPRLTVTARRYAGATGELAASAIASRSGLDGRGLLGLGAKDEIDGVVGPVIERVIESLDDEVVVERPPESIAVVPFGGFAERDGTLGAEAATEIAVAWLADRGFEVVSPNFLQEILRSRGRMRWGEIDVPTRRAIAENTGARWIVTGSVERWDPGADTMEPEPKVALSVRVLDAASGKVLWMGYRESQGWDGQTVFRLGRVYTRGALAERLLDKLLRRMVQELEETTATRRTR